MSVVVEMAKNAPATADEGKDTKHRQQYRPGRKADLRLCRVEDAGDYLGGEPNMSVVVEMAKNAPATADEGKDTKHRQQYRPGRSCRLFGRFSHTERF